MVWNLDLPERLKVFIWKCLKGILPVRENVATRLHHVPASCPLCGVSDESTKHLFCLCPQAVPVWEASDFQDSSDIAWDLSFNNWLLNWIIQLHKDKRRLSHFISILWASWKARNKVVFSDIPFNVASTIGMAKDSAQWFLHASNWLTKSTSLASASPIDKYPYFIVKNSPMQESNHRVCHLHVDGAWKEGKAWNGLGFTVSHPIGSLIAHQALSSYSSTPTQTEIQACYEDRRED